MYETLERLAKHLARTRGSRPQIVVWAHNSQVGEARATTMRGGREHNIGQLVRQSYPFDCRMIGFTTSHGTVTAASRWHGEAEHKVVRRPHAGSWEAPFHAIGIPNFALDLRQAAASEPALRAVAGTRDRRALPAPNGTLQALLPRSDRGTIRCDHALRPNACRRSRSGRWEPMFGQLLVPVDGSPAVAAGLESDIELAKQLDPILLLVQVVTVADLAANAAAVTER